VAKGHNSKFITAERIAQLPAATKRKTADARGCTQMNMTVQGFYPWTQNDRGILSLGLDYQTNESKDEMDQSVF